MSKMNHSTGSASNNDSQNGSIRRRRIGFPWSKKSKGSNRDRGDSSAIDPDVAALGRSTDGLDDDLQFDDEVLGALRNGSTSTPKSGLNSSTASGHRKSPLSKTNGDTAEEVRCRHKFFHSDPLSTDSGLDTNVPGVQRRMRDADGNRPTQQPLSLRIFLKDASGLMPQDSNGYSDPYCIIKIDGSRKQRRSRVIPETLSPVWNQEFFLPYNPKKEGNILRIEVFDRDKLSKDDYMGSNTFDLSHLEVNKARNETMTLLNLRGRKNMADTLGKLNFSISLVPDLSRNKSSAGDQEARLVTVDVIKARDLNPMDDNGLADPFVRVYLGKYKKATKVCYKTLNPEWKKRFEFPMWDNTQTLKLRMYDRDFGRKQEFMGSVTIDLSELSMDKPDLRWHPLCSEAGGATAALGEVFVQVIVTPLYATSGRKTHMSAEEAGKYVGVLKVNVEKALNLAGKDAGGKSDPFVELELGNTRLRTQHIPKTTNPVWKRSFEFDVRDIFDVLRISVFDYDAPGKKDFLGALEVPLLEMRNGVAEWYPLKNKTLMDKGKGEIYLSFDLEYKKLPAYRSLIKKREERHLDSEPKFKIPLLVFNVQRFRKILDAVINFFQWVDGLFNWEHGFFTSFVAMFIWILLCIYFEPHFMPLIVLLVFMRNYMFVKRRGVILTDEGLEVEAYDDDEDDDDDDDDDEEENKKPKRSGGLAGRIKQMAHVGQTIQNRLGDVASFGERVKNLFGWSVPTISWIICTVLMAATVALYFIPLRWILLVWGTRRFIKKGLMHYQPFGMFKLPKHHIKVNEMKELIGRVPDDNDLRRRRRLKPARARTSTMIGVKQTESATTESNVESSP